MKWHKLNYIAMLLLCACMKEPDLSPNFGSEITDEDYVRQMKIIQRPTFMSVLKDEYVYVTKETWVEGRPYMINNRWAVTVKDRQETANDFTLTLAQELREYIQGEEKISKSAIDLLVAKPNSTEIETQAVYANRNFPSEESVRKALSDGGVTKPQFQTPYSLLRVSPLAEEEDINFPRVTLHNLRVSEGRFPIPDFVKLKPDCGGLPPSKCKESIKAFFVSYEQVVWRENSGQRFLMTQVFSPEVPFFASTLSRLVMSPKEIRYFMPGVLQACVKSELPINNVQIQVTQCDEVKDFSFGR